MCIFIGNISIFQRMPILYRVFILFALPVAHIYCKYSRFPKNGLYVLCFKHFYIDKLCIFIGHISIFQRMTYTVLCFMLFTLPVVHIYCKYSRFLKNGLYCTMFQPFYIDQCTYLLEIFPFLKEWLELYYASHSLH